jgi:putative ABC transport system permease protein
MRLHSLLLHLYPSSFRAEYGKEMTAMFRRRREQATTALSILYLWIGEAMDIAFHAALVHWDIFRQDLRYTARTWARARGFALTAIVVTGLGIGANTAAFSVIDHVMLRPLPFRDPDRLVQLWQRSPSYAQFELSPPNFYDWWRLNKSFESMATYTEIAVNFLGQSEPRRIEGTSATPEFFQILGVQPLLGRALDSDDAREGATPSVLLSYNLWQNEFGGRPDILGNTLRLDSTVYTVVGVMPPDFIFPSRQTQFWNPFVLGDPPKSTRDNLYLQAIGKLKAGITLETARSEMNVIAAQLAREYPKENENVGAAVEPLSNQVSGQTRVLLWALFGASLCVLLVACSNLAGLLLAKAMARRKELTVRAAIGAGRERLVRQLLTESLLLALAGGIVGILVAMASLPLFSSLVPSRLPFGEISILDVRVFAFAALVTIATGFGFGVLPAIRIGSRVTGDGLKEGSRSGVGGHRERFRAALVIAEITVSVVLLVSAGLLMRALWQVQALDPGFRADTVIAVQTPLPMPRYGVASTRGRFYDGILSRVRGIPGVSNASFISSIPMDAGAGIWPVSVPGTDSNGRNDGGANTVAMRIVTPGYFATMRIPVRAGRDIAESDNLDAPHVAVVSESFARKYWPGQNPIGRTFHFAMTDFKFGQAERIIVGVAGDVRFRGLERQNEPQVYLSSLQLPDNTAIFYAPKELVLRSSEGVAVLGPAIRRIIRDADPELPISAIRTLREVIDRQTAPRSTQLRLIGAFAALALVLAGIGIHGLLSFAVGQRSPEFGLRIALGAQSRDILAMVLREGFILAGAGAILGLIISFYAGRSLQVLLAGVAPFDPKTVAAASGIALAMTLSGSLFPAIRAMRTDPTTVIRGD